MVSRDSELRQLHDDYASLDDRLLVLDFQAGHPEAFVEIHSRYSGLARSVCRRMLVNEHDADEAFQETMIRIFQGLHRFNGQYALRPWISRVATNVSIDAIRARDRRPTIDESPVEEHDRHDPADGPEQAVERLVDRDIVISVLSELPESHRTALVLRELEGRSHKEIGQSLGITPAQAKALIHRAKLSFRRGWFQTMAERGGVMGIALLPLFWVVKAIEGTRRVVDKIGGHAAQVAQAATPEVVSSTAASPAVTVVAGVSERVVAAGMAVLLAGGVTVGAAKLADRNKDKDATTRVEAVAPPVVEAPVAPVVPPEERTRPDRPPKHHETVPPVVPVGEGDTEPTVPAGTDTGESPSPVPDPTPSPTPDPDPVPPPLPPPAPAWSYDFITSTDSVESCVCVDTSTASNARIQPVDEGGFSFSQVISGGVHDAGGDVAWPFSLQQWGQVGPMEGRIDYRFRLMSSSGVFSYYGSGTLAETIPNEDGSTMYRFEGTFALLKDRTIVPGVPRRGFTSITVGVWGDGTLYTGSFALEDASS